MKLEHLSPSQTYKRCLTNISNFACNAYLYVWLPRQTLFDKHILLVNIFEAFQNMFCLSQAKNVCQAHVCVMAKPTLCLTGKTSNVCQTVLFRLAGTSVFVSLPRFGFTKFWKICSTLSQYRCYRHYYV